jgi:hypothetical protein
MLISISQHNLTLMLHMICLQCQTTSRRTRLLNQLVHHPILRWPCFQPTVPMSKVRTTLPSLMKVLNFTLLQLTMKIACRQGLALTLYFSCTSCHTHIHLPRIITHYIILINTRTILFQMLYIHPQHHHPHPSLVPSVPLPATGGVTNSYPSPGITMKHSVILEAFCAKFIVSASNWEKLSKLGYDPGNRWLAVCQIHCAQLTYIPFLSS